MSQEISQLRELETQIAQAKQADRNRLRKLLRGIYQAHAAGRPFDRNLARLQLDLEQSIAQRQRRLVGMPTIRYDEELPIAGRREEIAEAIRTNQVVVVCGETGSGKSTQLPKICLELGRGIDGMIGHTQPRRIAARSVGARIAEELGVVLGQQVGFKIRFTDATNPQTYIKLMTDGILLAESQHDRHLNQYDTLIIDEAHERSLNIDFLLGYLQRVLPKRPDLKLIITSATIDAERFAAHFGSTAGPAPIVQVSGRTYPVEIRYRPIDVGEDGGEPDWQRGVLQAVDEVARIDSGDILIFMPTERDIHETAKSLRGRPIPGDYPGQTTEILPLYARLSSADQNRVFKSHGYRRIVIATNVAESSLTVPGIRFVIDPGTARLSRYSPRSKVQRLPIEPIAQASADQRAGRCGRVGPGICLRLYSEQDYLSRDRYTQPEIQRTNLAAVILQTKSMEFGEIEDFPFLDPPKPEAIRDGYQTLFELGALDAARALTPLGRKLSRLPVDPRIGRMILAGHEEHCLHEILILAAALEVQDPRERPLEKQQAADQVHAQFAHPESDFLAYLKLWDYFWSMKDQLSGSQLRKSCKQSYLSYNRMREWLDVHHQLLEVVQQLGWKPGPRLDDYTAIHRALLTGLLSNVAQRGETNEYTVAGGLKVFLWPGSGTLEKKPKWIGAAELVETSRRYVRTIARIDPAWIERLATHLVSRSHSDPHWERARGSVMAFEKVSLFGLVIIPRRAVNFGPIDPVQSRELFIEHALVQGEFDTRADFLVHNENLLAELEDLQTKSRQASLIRSEDARFEFYDARIPPDVFDGPRFEKWRKTAEQANPNLLKMTAADLLEEEAEVATPAEFPDALQMRHLQLPLEYRFEPGTETDGITLTVPKEALNQLDPQRMGWLVPGLLEEKVTALIKSLPKDLRRRFVPVPDVARQLLKELKFGEGALAQVVATALSRMSGEEITAEHFQGAALPLHLQMNVRVVDAEGQALAAGRDVLEIKQKLGAAASASFAALDTSTWTRDGLTTWSFGDLPAQVDVNRGGMRLLGYPMLIDQGQTAGLRLVDSPERAAAESRAGVRRLLVLATRRELKAQVDWLPDIDQILKNLALLADAKALREQLIDLLAERAFFRTDSQPRTAEQFQTLVKQSREKIALGVQDLTGILLPLSKAYQDARLALGRSALPKTTDSIQDLREQLADLTQPGFLVSTPWGWLQHYPRYLSAMRRRLEKLAAGGLPRDQKALADIRPRWEQYVERSRQLAELGGSDPQLVGYRWMLEEYRVSVFAQELGTSLTISDKRLEKQWQLVRKPG